MTVAKKEIEKQVDWLKRFQEDKNSGGIAFAEGCISRIASFVYAVAEEAHAAGDEETATMAEQVASQTMPLDQYQDLVKRRVSENGTFRLTREELLGSSEK